MQIDGDSVVDVVGADSSGRLAWFKSEVGAPLTWTPNVISQTTVFRSVATRDVTNDGLIDVVSGGNNGSIWLHVSGGGSSVSWTSLEVVQLPQSNVNVRSVAVAIIDDDAHLDGEWCMEDAQWSSLILCNLGAAC